MAILTFRAHADWTASEPDYTNYAVSPATNEATWNTLECNAELGDMSIDMEGEIETLYMYTLVTNEARAELAVEVECDIDPGLSNPIGGSAGGSLASAVCAWAGSPPQIQFIEDSAFTEVPFGG
ncbi:MAG: hypothetical protein IT464_02800 [Planctomycetes bacterium]|nr:hypothetical protein [Planctomycetota bacterium]